nr:HAD-IC family P-type ATPase [Propionibacterium sp.]
MPFVVGHHALTVHEVVLLLETQPQGGLTEVQARDRLERYGPNLLPQVRSAGPVVRFFRQMHSPLVYVLLVAGTVTAVLGDVVDSAVIFCVVLLNTVIGFVQESKAESALDALRQMVRTQARVRRDGRTVTVASEEVVPGDVVLIEAGDKVPADLRLLEGSELQVDESALTGESVPVVKDEVVLDAGTAVSDRRNMLYSGTLVTNGTGVGVAAATGAETELGEIHRLVGSAEPLATPLTRRLTWFSKLLTVVILGLAALTFGLGLLRGEAPAEMFKAAVALAVAAIPEGLPAAVTITLAIGVSRMARRGAVVRRLPAVETLGSTTVICTDKTGTLTENQMTVQRVWTLAGRYEVSGGGYDPDGEILGGDGRRAELAADTALGWSLRAGVLCNDAATGRGQDGTWHVVGDPTEGALITVAAKAGLDAVRLRDRFPREGVVPFVSERQYMATTHSLDADLPHGEPLDAWAPGRLLVVAKGATERILELCDGVMGPGGEAHPLDRAALLREVDGLAAEGLRVLALARGTLEAGSTFDPESPTGSLTLVGLQAMLDPPRPAALHAVQSCRTAGIAVKMITGDHAATATAIARKVGLLDQGDGADIVTGPQLAALTEQEFAAAVERASVFARVSPAQKLRLVEALQAGRHVVAMTGDGVNDAPALRQADIGVAMGQGGTEVAEEAADMVLTDDDFATIEAAVEEGRGVFDNLTKFIVWTLPTSMGEGSVILVSIVLGLTLPVLPVQILWINMTTAVALGLMLAFEPKEAGNMRRPPRDPKKPLLSGPLVARILLVAAMLVVGSLWIFQWELGSGADVAEARTAALNLFIVVEAFYLFSCRSLTRSMWRIGVFSNRWILGGVAVQALAQVAITYLPVMNRAFSTAPISCAAWLRILAAAVLVSLVVAVDKRVRGGRI